MDRIHIQFMCTDEANAKPRYSATAAKCYVQTTLFAIHNMMWAWECVYVCCLSAASTGNPLSNCLVNACWPFVQSWWIMDSTFVMPNTKHDLCHTKVTQHFALFFLGDCFLNLWWQARNSKIKIRSLSVDWLLTHRVKLHMKALRNSTAADVWKLGNPGFLFLSTLG